MNHSEIILEDQTIRDGLQNEARIFTLEEKIKIIDMLIQAGTPRIQVGSFVHPKRVPQMADTDELIKTLGERPGVVFTGLILNDRGLDRALASGLKNVGMSVSASDAHSRRNVNRSAGEALESMCGLISRASSEGLTVRAGLQCAFGCVYEGSIDPDKVIASAEKMAEAGAHEINLADTTGMAVPTQAAELCGRVGEAVPGLRIGLHLHDTRGLGLANTLAGYDAGVRLFDVCTGGLGGCPFVKGAAGNVPTEDAVNAFESMGRSTGMDLGLLVDLVGYLENTLERELPGRMARVVRHRRGLCADNC